jgi:hypothetical protein
MPIIKKDLSGWAFNSNFIKFKADPDKSQKYQKNFCGQKKSTKQLKTQKL